MPTLMFALKLANYDEIWYWFVAAGLSVADTNTEANTKKVKYKCRWKYKTKQKVATLMFAPKVANENGIWYRFVTADLSVTDTNTETKQVN